MAPVVSKKGRLSSSKRMYVLTKKATQLPHRYHVANSLCVRTKMSTLKHGTYLDQTNQSTDDLVTYIHLTHKHRYDKGKHGQE